MSLLNWTTNTFGNYLVTDFHCNGHKESVCQNVPSRVHGKRTHSEPKHEHMSPCSFRFFPLSLSVSLSPSLSLPEQFGEKHKFTAAHQQFSPSAFGIKFNIGIEQFPNEFQLALHNLCKERMKSVKCDALYHDTHHISLVCPFPRSIPLSHSSHHIRVTLSMIL